MKLIRFIKLATLLAGVLFQKSAFPVDDKIEPAYELYNKGDYPQALMLLKQVDHKGDEDLIGELEYWKGVVQNKLQNFDFAKGHFKLALDKDYDPDDIFFEYAQALYATQELKLAKENFYKSIDEDFNILPSKFYVAYIHQTLEEYGEAKHLYGAIIEDKDATTSLRQASKYQLANIDLEELEKANPQGISNIVRKNIIPIYQHALYVDLESQLAGEINQKINALRKKYNVAPEKFINGRIISDKKLRIQLTEKLDYDSNVILEGEDFTPKSTDKSSGVNVTSLRASYDFIIAKTYVITPDFKAERTFHTERSNLSVSQNDNYNVNPALRFRWEHTSLGMATLIGDLFYNYSARDYKRGGRPIRYGNTVGFAVGYRANPLDIGESLLKIKYTSFGAYKSALDYTSFNILVTQDWKFSFNHRLFLLVNFDFKSVERSRDSKNTYLFKANYIVPEVLRNTLFSGGLGISFVDTKEQKGVRGTEKKINPTLALSRRISRYVDLSLNYQYVFYLSDDKANFQYKKHIVGIEAVVNF